MDADDLLSGLDRISERRIQEAIEAGEFDNLPGMGAPLHLDENPFVPKEMRAAYTVLSNSGFAPDWMVVGGEVENDLAQLRQNADRHFAYLRSQLSELASDPRAIRRLGRELSRLRALHRRVTAQHSSHIEEINSKITKFNHMVPIASLLKVPLAHAAEMAKFEDRVPAYLTYT